MNRLVILDRDGVINQDSDAFVKSADEWQPIPGSIDAIARLCAAGFTIAVATNQSGLGRGLFDGADLAAMHDKCSALVEAAGGEIAGFFFCPHTPDDGCDCRKPLPGLIDAIARELAVEVAGAALVGDSLRDLQAGVARGCLPLLVKTGKGEKTLANIRSGEAGDWPELAVFDDLAAVADYLIDNKLIADKQSETSDRP